MIKLPCYLTGFSSKSDGSASLRFNTQELTAEDFGELKTDLNEFGALLFRPNVTQIEDVPTEDVEDKNKTPSKRLRACLYVLHTQQGGKPETFEQFYRERMEQIIGMIKAKLD